MKKILLALFLLLSISVLSISGISANTTKVTADEVTHYDLNAISHSISVGKLVQAEWDHPDVTKFNMNPAPGDPGTYFENRTLEGGVIYIAHDNTFLYILADSIYVKTQTRLDYCQIGFDATNDKVGTSNTDMYFFTTFGANHVYFSQQVLYNASIDEEDGEVHGYDVSYCHNMPPQGLTPPLQMWGFFESTWNEPERHEVFTFKIPLTSFNPNFPDKIEAPTLPLTMGLNIELYKSLTNDTDANPSYDHPFVNWPAESNFSDQSTWGTITLLGEYVKEKSSPGFLLPYILIGLVPVILTKKGHK
ncbi:MAG: hypothetical protein ACTSW1_12995 [Candidatus Hodarchaeales archaeon]